MNNFTDYNTQLHTWDVNAFRPENKNGYTACHHHHQGQKKKNRPHQKTITYPHASPLKCLKNTQSFWVGVRALYGSHSSNATVCKYMQYNSCSCNGMKYISVLKRKTNMFKMDLPETYTNLNLEFESKNQLKI